MTSEEQNPTVREVQAMTELFRARRALRDLLTLWDRRDASQWGVDECLRLAEIRAMVECEIE